MIVSLQSQKWHSTAELWNFLHSCHVWVPEFSHHKNNVTFFYKAMGGHYKGCGNSQLELYHDRQVRSPAPMINTCPCVSPAGGHTVTTLLPQGSGTFLHLEHPLLLRCEDQQLQSGYSSTWVLAVSGQQAKHLPGVTPLPSIILPFILNRIGPVTMLSRRCCCKFIQRPEKDKTKSKNKQKIYVSLTCSPLNKSKPVK